VLCPQCHGKHIIIIDGQAQPCDECGGLGEVHCCEGLQTQPEPPAPVDQRQSKKGTGPLDSLRDRTICGTN
jgi:hypothetical protein